MTVPYADAFKAKYAERDEQIWLLYCSGKPMRTVARELDISPTTARKVIHRILERMGEPNRDMYRVAFLSQLDRLRALVNEVAEMPAPPAFSNNGTLLRDDDGSKVRDYSARLAAAKVVTALVDRQVKILGLDAPVRFEGTVTTETDRAINDLVAELNRRAPAREPAPGAAP